MDANWKTAAILPTILIIICQKKSIFEFESELMEAIHIRYLEEIRLKMTKLEWPHQRKDGQMDRQTDGQTDGWTNQKQFRSSPTRWRGPKYIRGHTDVLINDKHVFLWMPILVFWRQKITITHFFIKTLGYRFHGSRTTLIILTLNNSFL